MTNQIGDSSRDRVIRISRDEAMGDHVDDLLKRQMSLRGERGVSRGGRRWYYRNWFVFMIVGTVAALSAWALTEPHFDDTFYLQGSIERMNLHSNMPSRFYSGDQYIQLNTTGVGWVEVNGQEIWLLTGAKELLPDGGMRELDPASLREGQEIGIHVESPDVEFTNVAFARFVTTTPPENPPAKARMSLSRLTARSNAAGLLLFPLVAGLVGLALGAADGLICRVPRRALLGGVIGLLVGFIGGFVSSLLGGLVYMPLNALAFEELGAGPDSMTTFGFLVQMAGRTLAWGLAGMAMGLGQGIALRSKRLFLYGFLGGVIGGLIGGLLFDPIDLLLLGFDRPSAHWSRLIGLAVIGASVGAMIGIVELLARDAWLRMIEGPLSGKEFLIFKDLMKLGSSPRSDIYLFNDPSVVGHHASLRATGDECEIENLSEENPLLVNNRPVRRTRLRHADRITIGRTSFVFEKRQG